MISDGESWSGEVARSIERATREHVPLHVIGVGTLAGGTCRRRRLTALKSRLPASRGSIGPRCSGLPPPAVVSTFELDRDPDRDIANEIIDAGRRQAPATTEEGTIEELYWRCFAAATLLAALGSVFLRERTELGLQLTAAVATALVLSSVLWLPCPGCA